MDENHTESCPSCGYTTCPSCGHGYHIKQEVQPIGFPAWPYYPHPQGYPIWINTTEASGTATFPYTTWHSNPINSVTHTTSLSTFASSGESTEAE